MDPYIWPATNENPVVGLRIFWKNTWFDKVCVVGKKDAGEGLYPLHVYSWDVEFTGAV